MDGLVFWQGLFALVFSSDPLSESAGPWVYALILLLGIILFPIIVVIQQVVQTAALHLSVRICWAPRILQADLYGCNLFPNPLLWGYSL